VRLIGIKYLRASQDRYGKAISGASQGDEGDEFFEEHDIEDAGTFFDNDISASLYSDRERPEYERALDALRSGRANLLWTFESGRAQKDIEVYARLRRLLIEVGGFWAYGGRIYDMTDPNDRKATLRDAVEAEGSSDVLSMHVRRGLRLRAKEGLWAGTTPYGYRREFDQRTGKALGQFIDEEQKKVVREIVDKLLSCTPLTAIANGLNERGVPPSQPYSWSYRLVLEVGEAHRSASEWQALLSRTTEAGGAIAAQIVDTLREGVAAREIAKDLNRRGVPYLFPAKWNAVKVRGIALSPAAAGLRQHQGKIIGKGQWDPIITEEERTRLLAWLRSDKRRTNRDGTRVKHWWSGIARCGVCDEPLIRRTSHKLPRYTCRSRSGCVSRVQVKLDAYLTEQALRVLERTDAAQLFRIDHDASDSFAAQAEAQALRAELEGWRQDARSGKVSRESFVEIEPGLLERIAKANERAKKASLPPVLVDVIGPGARQTFLALGVAEQRAILRAIMRPRIHRAKTRRFDGTLETETIDPGFLYAVPEDEHPAAV
jgi:DNA invertase Pin-like site-specific DNA recombinase